MSFPKTVHVMDESEDDISGPQNDQRQTSIDKTTYEATERSIPRSSAERAGHKHKSSSRVQGKGSSPGTTSVRKHIARSALKRNPTAQSTASAKSLTKSPKNPPRVVRFDVAGQGSLVDQTEEKKFTTTFEEEDNLDGVRALEVLQDPTPSILTQEDLEQSLPPQPLLPRTDADFEDRYRELKAAAMNWVKQHFSKEFAKPLTALDLVQVSNKTPELIQYINFIASSGKDSWEDIFVERRIALVYGVLGKVIEIHVFGEEMFGANDRQRTTLRGIDVEMLNLNGQRLLQSISPEMHLADFHSFYIGFTRQHVRAGTINAFLSAHDRALPPEFVSSLVRLQVCLSALVSPFLGSPPPPKFHHDLSRILFLAAKLSLDMRREPATIYYVTSIASSGAFEPRFTEILNPQQLAEAEPWHEDYEEPVIRVAAWPSIFAYRPGNGREGGEEDGFRTRRIGKSEAYVKWGSLIPFRMRAHHTTTYPANSEPNTSLRVFLTQQQQQQRELSYHDTGSSSSSSEQRQQQTGTTNQRTPSSVDRRLLMARAVAAAGGIGVVGAMWAVTTTFGGDIAQAAGTFGGEAAEVLKGLAGDLGVL